MLNDLYVKYEQLENFLKDGNKFTSQCIDLKRRSAMVEDCEEFIDGFSKSLKKVSGLENYLNFQPIIEPKTKLESIKKLEMTHLK